MNKRRILCFAIALIMLVSTCTVFAMQVFAEGSAPISENGEIDVWLIAGQSNAVGYGSDSLSPSKMNDKRYTDGFENVLFFGNYESTYNPEEFVPVTVGLGKQSTTNKVTVGAEIGIASALGDGNRMNAVIKHAVGASYLYPTTNGSAAQNHGTWTSPSYLEKYGINTETNKIGDLYTGFLNTVSEGIEMLVKDGYTPVIKGVWWMQGEAETEQKNTADAYEELLTTFISDLRRDLGAIVNADLSALPFVMGKITRNPGSSYSQPAYVETVNAAQRAVVSTVNNTYIVDTTGLKQLDGWHYSADSQLYIGETFVNTVILSEGKFAVTMKGENASMNGGGAKAAGDEVTVTILPYEGCTINSVTMTVGTNAPVEIALDANSSYTFTMPEGAVVFTVDAIDPDAEATQYGVIPSIYTDSEKYPFLLFKNGKLLHAFENWHSFANGNNVSDCTLLLRRDYSTTESGAHAWGICYLSDLTIDLGGYTLTRGDYHLIQALGKGSEVNNSSITFKNGTLKTTFLKSDGKGASPIIVFNNDANNTVADNFTFTLDGITIDVSSGRGIVAVYGDGTEGSNAKIILNNCTIDRGNSTSSITLFDLADSSGNKNDIDVIINGGKLITDTASNLTFAKFSPEREANFGSPDSIRIDDSFKILLPSSYSYNGNKFTFTDASYYLVDPTADSETGRTAYSLLSCSTKYGDIAYDYLSESDYPFVLFKDGVMKVAFKDWKTFIDSTVYKNEDYKTGCTLVLRRDYTTTEASNSIWALSYVKDMVIDLCGNTLTRGDYHLFHANGHGTSASKTEITVLNGTLKTQLRCDNNPSKNSHPLIVFNNDAGSKYVDTYAFVFNNVTFDVSSGRGIVAAYGDGTFGTNNTITLNNCNIYRGASTSAMTLFDMADTSGNKNDISVMINGGKLTADSVANLVFAKFSPERESGAGAPDSITANAGFKVILPESYSYTGTAFSFSNGTHYLTDPVSIGSGDLSYSFLNATTKYGVIAYNNISAADYPFVLFKNGVMIHAFSDWGVFINSGVYKTANYRSGCTLLLRRDYSSDECTAAPWALAYIDDLTIDLGGNSITRGKYHIFQFLGRSTEANESKITFINGTLVSAGAAPIIVFNNDKSSACNDKIELIFNEITFDVSSGKGIVITYSDGTFGTEDTLYFNNCTIDCGSYTKAITLFNLAESSGNKNDIDVIIKGGKLIAKSFDNITMVTTSPARTGDEQSPDSLTFERDENGNHFTLILPKNAKSPSEDTVLYTTDGIRCALKKVSEEGEIAIYSLHPIAISNYTIKTSVTLWSNLVYNIYIPKTGVASFTVNGEAPEFTETEIDGVIYYHISVDLPAKDTLSDIILKVDLISEETTVRAKWTLNVLSYAKKVLDDSTTDAANEKLIKDMLAYATSAHIYFGTADAVSEKIEEISDILSSYTSSLPKGTAKAPNNSKFFKDASVYLGATPSFRFYLNEGYTANDFTFKIGGKTVNANISEDGKYIEITVYAYMMLDDVTYTVTDKDNGTTATETWNIYAYYDYAKSQNNASLTAIVEGLMKYSSSSKEYKISVTEN